MVLFEIDVSYGTLNVYRSMVPLIPSDKVEENRMVLILKKRLQSINSEYSLTWGAAQILEYLKMLYPLEKSINKELHGEICCDAVNTGYDIYSAYTSINIKIENVKKTAKSVKRGPWYNKLLGSKSVSILIDTLEVRTVYRIMRVTSAILEYLERTRKVRGEIINLFISIKEVY